MIVSLLASKIGACFFASFVSVMKTLPPLLFMILASVAFAQEAGFSHVTLVGDGKAVMMYRSNGHTSSATKLQDQSAFAKPAISSNGKYVGWLALYPDQGASYAQPLKLVLEDDRDRVYEFAGSFGMVFGWCFAKEPNSVTFTYSFPHGRSPVVFQTRSIRDGKVVRHFELDPSQMDKVVGDVAPPSLPEWARCAWESAHASEQLSDVICIGPCSRLLAYSRQGF